MPAELGRKFDMELKEIGEMNKRDLKSVVDELLNAGIPADSQIKLVPIFLALVSKDTGFAKKSKQNKDLKLIEMLDYAEKCYARMEGNFCDPRFAITLILQVLNRAVQPGKERETWIGRLKAFLILAYGNVNALKCISPASEHLLM